MIKKINKVLSVLLLLVIFIPCINASSSNTSLKDLKEKLASDQAKVNNITSKKSNLTSKIKSAEKELINISNEIDECETNIELAKAKIVELKKDIANKQIEIDNLISFKQISSGDNVYLEYIFNAKSFTDFIYRISIVEQLTKYNDNLIDEMNDLIAENEKTQKDLKKKIEQNEKNYSNLNKTLSSYNLSMDDLDDDHKDAKSELEASKKEVEAYEKLYKQYGCKETDSIVDCVKVPYADGLTRPVVKGTITSNFGLRYHPTLHYYRSHNGIDIGVSMNTKVYASAAGIVTKIVEVANPKTGKTAKKNSSCGGNKIYIKHRIDGKEYTTSYLHLHQINVKLNDYVTLDTVIGYSGGGESYDYCTTGPHLHFAVQTSDGTYVNPRNYVDFPKLNGRFTSRF